MKSINRKFPLLCFLAVLIVAVMAMAFMPGLVVLEVGDELAVTQVLGGEANLGSAMLSNPEMAPATYNMAGPASPRSERVLQPMVAVLFFLLAIAAVIVGTKSLLFDGLVYNLRVNPEARTAGRRRTKFILPAAV